MKAPAIYFVTLAFFIEQNVYFGWNRFPASDAELIADGITMMLGVFAIMAGKETP